MATPLPAAIAWWRDFAVRYVTALCALPQVDEHFAAGAVAPPAGEALAALAAAAPPMTGAERLNAAALAALWREIDSAFGAELAEAGVPVQDDLRRHHAAWNLVGRVHFNLAVNRGDDGAPFAFLATCATGLSAQGTARHLPLGRALQEGAGASSRELLSLLLPVQRAAARCGWLRALVDSGDIFHPLRWTPEEALALLRDAAVLEAAGVVLRMPARWRGGRPARAQATATVGAAMPSAFGADALLDFSVDVTVDGEPLGAAEIADLLAQTGGLAWVRGRWVEVDRDRLGTVLAHLRGVEATAAGHGLSFGEARRCGCSPAPTRRARRPSLRPPSTGRRWWPAGGWPTRCGGCAAPRRWPRSTPARHCTPRCGPSSRWVCAGCTCWRRSAWAFWGKARCDNLER